VIWAELNPAETTTATVSAAKQQLKGEIMSETVQNENQADKGASGFGAIFSAATTIWKDNIGGLAVISLVFLLVAWIPIVNIAFLAGYIRALTKTIRGEKPTVGDIFAAWDCFGQMLVYVIIIVVVSFILGFIPILGTIAAIAISFIVVPGVYPIVDQGMTAMDAFKWSYAAFKQDIANWILVILLGGFLSGIGVLALGIGLILTLPWGYLLFVQQYEKQKNLSL
jgi:hypothetical protein